MLFRSTEREHEIELFKPEEFWTLSINFQDKNKNNITSSISQLDGDKIEKFSFKKKEENFKKYENIKFLFLESIYKYPTQDQLYKRPKSC